MKSEITAQPYTVAMDGTLSFWDQRCEHEFIVVQWVLSSRGDGATTMSAEQLYCRKCEEIHPFNPDEEK